jgi:hypothetical protein
MALNNDVETDNDVATTPVAEEQTAGDIEGVESADVEETLEIETEEGSKKGLSNRVRELNARDRTAEEKNASLVARLEQLAGNGGQQDYLPYQQPIRNEPIVQPGEEIDAYELDRRLQARESRILQQADALSTLKAKQSEAINRINNEAVKAMQKYPELDPENERFDKDLSDAITEATESYVGRNPYDASIINFVDKMMRPYKGAVSKGVGEMTKSVAKQVSDSALRPTSIREKEKSATDKTIAELEAQLGVVQA